MSNGIQTIQAANNGMTSITSLVQQLQSVASQAASDTTQASVTPGTALAWSGNTSTAGGQLNFTLADGSSVGVATFSATQAGFNITDNKTFAASAVKAGTINIQSNNINGGQAISVTLTAGETAANVASAINSAIVAADPTNGSHVWAAVDATSGGISLTNDQGNSISVSDGTGGGDTAAILGTATGAATTGTVLGAASIAAEINSNSALSGLVKASVDATSGALNLQSLTTSPITMTGETSGAIDGSSSDTAVTLAAATGGGLSATRQSLMNQFKGLLTQINQTASDSGYNGTNLLNGDSLTLKFNQNGTSSLTVQMQDSGGNPFSINATNLGLIAPTTAEFGSNAQLANLATTIQNALNTLQAQSTSISGSLSVVQNRQNFTTQMINTLQTGADNLVLADPNLEGANLLALQTRQSLSTTALSMASQAQQAVLRLFQ